MLQWNDAVWAALAAMIDVVENVLKQTHNKCFASDRMPHRMKRYIRARTFKIYWQRIDHGRNWWWTKDILGMNYTMNEFSLSLSLCWFMSPRICMNNFFVCHFHHIKIFIILYYKLYHWHSIVAKMTTINAQCTCTLYSTPGWRWKRATTSSSHDNDIRLFRHFQLYTFNVEDCAKMSWLKNKICEIRVRQNVIHKISFYVL